MKILAAFREKPPQRLRPWVFLWPSLWRVVRDPRPYLRAGSAWGAGAGAQASSPRLWEWSVARHTWSGLLALLWLRGHRVPPARWLLATPVPTQDNV